MSTTINTTDELLSPQLLHQLERLELISRKIFRGRMKGERRSRRKGQSVEFADFRNYVPGLFLKIFLEEEDLHFFTLLDASRSMDFGDPTKLHYAKQLAAALGFIGLCRADRVKVDTLGQPLHGPSPVLRGRASLWRMIEHLQQIAPAEMENVSLETGVRNFALRNRGQGILVLITDLMDKHGYQSALRYLLARDLDIYLVHVLSPEELNPEISGDLRLIDAEDSDVAEVTVSRPLLTRYQKTLASFIEEAKSFCNQRGIAYLLANPEIPVDRMVTNYLRQRGLVR